MTTLCPSPIFDDLTHLSDEPTGFTLQPHQQADLTKAISFLQSYRGSLATFNAYRRELERLFQWCWLIANKNITDLKRQDIEAFIEFCKKPPLTWIGSKNCQRFIEKDGLRIANESWRPFVVSVSKIEHLAGLRPQPKNYAVSQKTLQAIFAIVGSFYQFLIQESYCEHNPVYQIRQKSKYFQKQTQQTITRRLSPLQWSYVIEVAEKMAAADPEHERTLFIMNALFGMYLRISELATSARWQPQMGHFFRDMDGNWWFTTVGKGNKQRNIAVSDAMLAALKRYRLSLSLSPFPSPHEKTPLLQKQRGRGAIASTRHIRQLVQNCFDETATKLCLDGFQEEAQQLQAATVHWLRHTGISEDVKIRPREHVRDDAGHGSSAITDKYIDVELRERHASSKKKLIKPLM